MTRRPEHRHVDDLTRHIRDAPLRDINRRLINAIDLNRRGGLNTIDGYPTATMGGTRGDAELTSVEAAAALRIGGRRSDPIHDATIAACGFLEDAVRAIHACVNTLDRLDALRAVGADSGEPGCESCSRERRSDGGTNYVPIHPRLTSRTDVAGRLTDPRWLCKFCYEWVIASGQLPSRDIVRQHQHGPVRRPA